MGGRVRVACCADRSAVANCGGARRRCALRTATAAWWLAVATGLGLSSGDAAAGEAQPFSDALQQSSAAGAEDMGGLQSATLAEVHLSGEPGGAVSLQLPIEGRSVTLDLAPQSVLSDDYKLMAQVVDGDGLRLVAYPSARPTTLRGNVREIEGAQAAITATDAGLYGAVLLADGTMYWIEPAPVVEGEPAGSQHVIYRDADLTGQFLSCGESAAASIAAEKPGDGSPEQVPRQPLTCVGPCVAEVAFDADHEFFSAYGSVPAVETRIITLLNIVNLQYEAEVGITHIITEIVVRTAEPDPYTSNDYQILLPQFRREWLNNQAHVHRDVAQLFTGRTMAGNVVGYAGGLGGVCTPKGYSFVWSDCCGTLACATNLTAHELGHSWGADHCDCPMHTMNAINSCANQFNPTDTIPEILAYRDTRTCLNEGSPPPENDSCQNPLFVSDGTYPFSTLNAETDGPDEPGACSFFDYTQIGSDVWFCYTATCSGAVTASLCGSSYDTKMVVYDGCSCPSGDGVLACNDDFCGAPARQSQVSFAAEEGHDYMIRVGGFEGWTGDGVLSIGCTPGGPVCGDGTIEPPETCDPPDGATCDQNCAMTNAANNCCFIGHGTGCSDAAIEACVCNSDPFCCLVTWDSYCVDDVDDFACGVCGAPANDACADAIPITEGIYPFDTEGATTDGPNEPAQCNVDGYAQVGADIWFCYTPSCTGQASFSLCDSFHLYDTKMAIYQGCDCPTSAQAIACNDDACGPGKGRQSLLSVTTVAGVELLVRVGGYNNATGSGILTASCVECGDTSECDNGRYCDGNELCVGGLCRDGFEPCTLGQWCNEPDDVCFDYGDGDFDGDGDLDLVDFASFQGCFGLVMDPDCGAGNMTGMPVINLADYEMFWQNMTAPSTASGE